MQAMEDMAGIPSLINDDNDNIRSIVAQDSFMAKNQTTMDREQEERKLEDLFRRGVKSSEAAQETLRKIIESLRVVAAVQRDKENDDVKSGLVPPPPRSSAASGRPPRAREREKERVPDPYDFDVAAADSPVVLSPSGRKGAGSTGTAAEGRQARDSLPPRSGTPAADSVDSQSLGPGVASAAQRSRVAFVKGQDVVFKPKPSHPNEGTDWFLGKVQQVIGDGKARRYKVKDEDPDLPPEQRQEYRTHASNMIPLPPVGQELPDLEKGKTVLALYPDSTTFYKAEVMSTDKETGKVNLRFEGEENSGTLQVVERRFVVEYRN